MAPPGECYYNTLLCCDYFSSPSVVSRAFSALWVHSKFGHYPHPLGYLCAKFRFFRGLHCCASPWKKSRTQSVTITHSVSRSLNHSASLFNAPRTETLALRNFPNKICTCFSCLETSTIEFKQCAQFVVNYFFRYGNLTYFSGSFRSSNNGERTLY